MSKTYTVAQMDYSDLKNILAEAQAQALAEAASHMYDKFSHVYFSIAEVCRLHSTCYRTINDMTKAGIIIPDENGKFNAAEVLKWDFSALKKQLRYRYKSA